MSHTPEQLEIAKRIVTFMDREHQMEILPGDYERFADALAYATKPPEGAIEIKFAVGAVHLADLIESPRIDWFYEDKHQHLAEADAFRGGQTHRAIVRAWIPRVAPTPVVEGSVSK